MKLSLLTISVFAILTISCHDRLTDKEQAESTLQYCRSRLDQGKTYVFEDGIEKAIGYFESAGDTTALIDMYSKAAIRMRWKNEQDSAAMYLNKALSYTTGPFSKERSVLNIALSNLYAHPLLHKDYLKAIAYARQAVQADTSAATVSRALHDIGLFYSFINEPDSASWYFEQALSNMHPAHPDYTTMILNYADIAEPDKSIRLLRNISDNSLGKLITLGFVFLNNDRIDSANHYLNKSIALFRENPGKYSINTINSLRLLSACVGYAGSGKVVSDDEIVRYNDSISGRLSLDRLIDAERAEHASDLQLQLLESESKRQRIWIGALAVLLLASVIFTVITLSRKRKMLKMREELEAMRLSQIIKEADESVCGDSLEIIRRRAEICIDRFRKSGMVEMIQKGEMEYKAHNTYITVKNRSALQRALLECFSDVIIDLRMDAGKLSMDDIITCLLSLMRLSNTAISACLGCTEGAVRTRRTRLKGKLSPNLHGFIFI